MKFIVIITLFLISQSGWSEAQKVASAEPAFTFDVDAKVRTGDADYSAIQASDLLKNDKFLQAPMTHLEYVVDRMEHLLNKDSSINLILKKYGKFFERKYFRGSYWDLEVKGNASYDSKVGKIFLSYSIEDAGPPKSSFKELCKNLINEMSYILTPNEELGTLIYDENLKAKLNEKIKENTVHMISIHTTSEEGQVHHHFFCTRESVKDQIVFNKFSTDLRNKKKIIDEK